MKSTKLFILLILLAPAMSWAGEASKRSKSINFEDDVIEGINRKSLDSVSQISENDAHKKAHLYKKRATFADRDQSLLQSMVGAH